MIVIILHIEVAILFISQYRKKRDIPLRLAIGLFFVFMAMAFIVLFVVRYFLSIVFLVNVYNVLLAVSMLAFCYQVERDYSKRMKTRRFFTYICIGIIPFALLLRADTIFYYGVSVAIGIVAIFPAIFLAYLLKKNRGQVRKQMELALVGVLFTLFGNYGMTFQFGLFLTEWLSTELSIVFFVAARVSITFGLLLLFYGFSADIFLESDWRKYLMEYYIIENKSGKALFYKNLVYASEGEVPDTALFSGGIVGIMAMIQEFTQSEKELNVIDKGSIKILIERGDLVTAVFVVKENLSILQFLLRKTVEEFESTLGVFLTTTPWEGDTEVFRATGTIMDQLFEKF